MTTGFHRETAKIYQFPIGGRASSKKFSKTENVEIFPKVANVAVDFGAWYHQEAVADTDKDSKPHS